MSHDIINNPKTFSNAKGLMVLNLKNFKKTLVFKF